MLSLFSVVSVIAKGGISSRDMSQGIPWHYYKLVPLAYHSFPSRNLAILLGFKTRETPCSIGSTSANDISYDDLLECHNDLSRAQQCGDPS